MSSIFGKNVKVSIFGESHGVGIGAVMDGLPAGEKIDFEQLNAFLQRRAPGKSKLTTQRREKDQPEFLSGIYEDKTTGSPLAAVIRNTDQRSKDYSNLKEIPRPSHADLTSYYKYGAHADMRGGGHFSGRLTAPLCIAGGIAKQILERRGIYIGAQLFSVGQVEGESFRKLPLTREEVLEPGQRDFPVAHEETAQRMKKEIEAASKDLDSVGGRIECAAIGLPYGVGNPIFEGLENRIAQMIFGIPGVKSLEFGQGIETSLGRGSDHNDPIDVVDGEIVTRTNNSGGINGGISNGMPIVIRVGMKPTPSIARAQDSISLKEKEKAKLEIRGRHDPCIAIRAVPVVEAAMALVLLDELVGEGFVRRDT